MTNSIKNVCVFASSSSALDESFLDDARKLGLLLGENNYNIVYGGSRLGLMYACAGAVKEKGKNIIGIMPERIAGFGCANPDDCNEFFVTSGMRERKAMLDNKSDAIIALPGGYGTLEELSEMIVQKQLGYNKKPIIILNTNNFYNSLLQFFEDMISLKFANKESRNLYYVAKTPEEAISYLNEYSESDLVSKYIIK